MEHAFNPSSQDEEACEFKANLIYTANFRKAIDSGLKKKKKGISSYRAPLQNSCMLA